MDTSERGGNTPPIGATMSPVQSGDAHNAFFEVSLPPSLNLVSDVRHLAGAFCTEMIMDAEATSRVVLTTHELLENAIRFSAGGQAELRIGVRRERSRMSVRVETRNVADPVNVEDLRRRLHEMSAATDPDAHYMELMHRALGRSEGSGLGLGRIRAEAEMALGCAITGNAVDLHATTEFDFALRPAA